MELESCDDDAMRGGINPQTQGPIWATKGCDPMTDPSTRSDDAVRRYELWSEHDPDWHPCPACGRDWTIRPDRSRMLTHTDECDLLAWYNEEEAVLDREIAAERDAWEEKTRRLNK